MNPSAIQFVRSLEELKRLTKNDLQCQGLDLGDEEWDRFAKDRVSYLLEIATWAKAAIWDAIVERALTGASK